MTTTTGETALTGRMLLASDDLDRAAVLIAGLRASGAELAGPVYLELALAGVATARAAGVLLDLSIMNAHSLALVAAIRRTPQAPVVVVRCPMIAPSGVVACVKAGAAEYLTPEVSLRETVSILMRSIHEHRTSPPQARDVPTIGWDWSGLLTAERRASSGRAAAALDTLTAILEAQDAHYLGHAARVADLAASTAATLGLGNPEIEELRVAGRLHDLGMVVIPATVLQKAGPLTSEEMALVRSHPAVGAQIVRTIVDPGVQSFIRGHHERWDGAGYPDQLAGRDIPLGARILAVAEVFDALTSDRPHRGRHDEEEALRRLRELAGSALDPMIVDAAEPAVRQRRGLAFLSSEHPGDLGVDTNLWGADQARLGPGTRTRNRLWAGPDPESL